MNLYFRPITITLTFLLVFALPKVLQAQGRCVDIFNDYYSIVNAEKLKTLGFTVSVANRIGQHSEVAKQILSSSQVEPIVDFRDELGHIPGHTISKSPVAYRGYKIPPGEYQPGYISKYFNGDMYVGNFFIASMYSRPAASFDREMPVGTMIHEVQVPKSTLVEFHEGNKVAVYSRDKLPNESIIINRVGFYLPFSIGAKINWGIPESWRAHTRLFWFEYDRVYDKQGRIKAEFDIYKIFKNFRRLQALGYHDDVAQNIAIDHPDLLEKSDEDIRSFISQQTDL